MDWKRKMVSKWLQIALGVMIALAWLMIKAKHERKRLESLELPQEVELFTGKSRELVPVLRPIGLGDIHLWWMSSDTTIAKVDDRGVVYAGHEAGDCFITVTASDGSGLKATTKVIVRNERKGVVSPYLVDRIDMAEEITLPVGQVKQLHPTVSPDDAVNRDLAWSSANPSVATVSNGLVKGLAEGSAVITAYATDASNTSAQCIVQVIPGDMAAGGYQVTDVVGELQYHLSRFSESDIYKRAEIINDMMPLFAQGAEVSVRKDGIPVQKWLVTAYFKVIRYSNTIKSVRVEDVRLDSSNKVSFLCVNENWINQ